MNAYYNEFEPFACEWLMDATALGRVPQADSSSCQVACGRSGIAPRFSAAIACFRQSVAVPASRAQACGLSQLLGLPRTTRRRVGHQDLVGRTADSENPVAAFPWSFGDKSPATVGVAHETPGQSARPLPGGIHRCTATCFVAEALWGILRRRPGRRDESRVTRTCAGSTTSLCTLHRRSAGSSGRRAFPLRTFRRQGRIAWLDYITYWRAK